MFLMAILFITHTIKFMEYKKTSEVIIDVNTKEVNKVGFIIVFNRLLAEYQHDNYYAQVTMSHPEHGCC
jgi:hypothetical protein